MADGRVNDLVNYLFNSPGVSGGTALQTEGAVVQFLLTNFRQLEPALRQPQFFPDRKPNEVLALLMGEIKRRTMQYLSPKMLEEINRIDFTFLVQQDRTGSFSAEMFRKYTTDFVLVLLESTEARLAFNASFNLLHYKILDRYVSEIFTKRTPTYFELTRVQRNNLSAGDYLNYLRLLLIIRPAAFRKVRLEGFSESEVSLSDFMNVPPTMENYFAARTKSLYQELPGMPPELFRMALRSNINSAHHTQENRKADRGAETPDKSWFSVARKNVKHNGFDKRMLDDLYLIAGNNGW